MTLLIPNSFGRVMGTLVHLVIFLVMGASPARGEGTVIELVVDGPAVPADRIVYRIANDEMLITASVTEVVGTPFVNRSTFTLLQPTEWRHVSESIKQAFQNSCPSSTSERIQYRLLFKVGTKTQHCTFGERSSVGSAFESIPDTIRSYSALRTGRLIPRDARLNAAQSGTLFIESRPSAWIQIDGVELRRRTPVSHLHLVPGRHRIGLKPDRRGPVWDFDVSVIQGQSVILDVDLK